MGFFAPGLEEVLHRRVQRLSPVGLMLHPIPNKKDKRQHNGLCPPCSERRSTVKFPESQTKPLKWCFKKLQLLPKVTIHSNNNSHTSKYSGKKVGHQIHSEVFFPTEARWGRPRCARRPGWSAASTSDWHLRSTKIAAINTKIYQLEKLFKVGLMAAS